MNERDAEAERMQDVAEQEEIPDMAQDESVEEAQVHARRAPRELTEAERLRHEATHIPIMV